MRAILSDIHGNLEALQAVLADAEAHGVSKIYCLGDLVGYGPDPIACVELAMAWPVVLLGNHDQAAMLDDDLDSWTAQAAKRSIFKFRRQLQETGKAICNVGSVGQPRDGDPRACYVLFEDDTIIFCRIDYDIEKSIKKIERRRRSR